MAEHAYSNQPTYALLPIDVLLNWMRLDLDL